MHNIHVPDCMVSCLASHLREYERLETVEKSQLMNSDQLQTSTSKLEQVTAGSPPSTRGKSSPRRPSFTPF